MDWESITSSQFEDLCCEYARTNYRDFNWEPTPRSWDGNRDGEFIVEIESLNQLVKGWYESKYTKNTNQSIPHSHMDSTLVSGILDGHVVYILFITNGKITHDFKRRANAILQPHRIDVNFVDGEILEEWLLENPDIYAAYFGEEDQPIGKINAPKLIIEDVCFFDCVLCAPTLTEPVKSLSIGNEYFLYIGVRSNISLECSISLNTDCLRIFSNNTINVTKYLQFGYNSLFLKCQAKGAFGGKLILKVASTSERILDLWEQKNFVIKDDFCPKIVHRAQLNAVHQMFELLKAGYSDNSILGVIGPEGSGKSYLHRKLIESLSREQHESLSIQLSEKKAENACALCKLILFLNFGYLYKLSEDAFFSLIENSVNLPLELFAKLREGASNQITALHVISEVLHLLQEQDVYALTPTYNLFMHRRTEYIFIDDLQKLDKEYSQLFQSLLLEFNARKFSQVMILGYRAGEFQDPQLEKYVQEIIHNTWTLGKVTPEDIKETLTLEFNSDIGELSQLFPQPLNVLHLLVLVKQLKRKNITRLNLMQATTCFSDAYQIVNSQNNHFAKHKIESVEYLDEINLIYKVESGIPKSVLFDFWGSNADVVYSNLIAQDLIREEGQLVVPFHDAYLYAFQKQITKPDNSDDLICLLNFIQKLEEKYPILESNLISILISKENMSDPSLRKNAYKYCRDYYNASQYTAAKAIAKSLIPDIEISLEQFSDDMVEILYIYAQSVKFTESHTQSTKLFRKVIQLSVRNSTTPEIRDIGLDALSEVLNNEMWMLNFDETSKCIKQLRKFKTNVSTTHYGENAYLNYLNRKMMCESFTAPTDCADSYAAALSESKRLERKDYEAYAKMDRARILYPTSPGISLQLLIDARTFFSANQKYYRRMLESSAEIVFLEYILRNTSYDELYKIQKEMLFHGYINSYAKTTIKILTIEAVCGAVTPEGIKIRLNRLTLQYPDVLINKRISIAIYQLLSLCSYIDHNETNLIKYSKKQFGIVAKMNESYKRIPEHNQSCELEEEAVTWAIGNALDEKSFWIDPRLW